MIRINKAQFQENVREWHDGVYVFELDGCSSCDRYTQILKETTSKKKIYIIDCNEDLDYYLSLGMSTMPETRLYVCGEPKVIIRGVPKQKDLEILFYEELEDCSS